MAIKDKTLIKELNNLYIQFTNFEKDSLLSKLKIYLE